MNETSRKAVETLLDHRFNNAKQLETALTHSSVEGGNNYERLEFLGDRVVGLAVADILIQKFPHEAEGNLAKRHAMLVQGHTLADIAKDIKLGDHIVFSDAERAAGGADNENILADCIESVIGALYLDSSFEKCRKIIAALWGNRFDAMQSAPQEPKTALQEWAQARALPLPVYDVLTAEGPDHAPVFEIQVTVDTLPPKAAKAKSRRAAEKAAASLLLDYIHDQVNDQASDQTHDKELNI